MGRRKSAREKLANSRDLPRVETITAKMSKRWGMGTVVIPTPREVDEIMKQVPRGKLIAIHEIRKNTGRPSVVPLPRGYSRGLPHMPPRRRKQREWKG